MGKTKQQLEEELIIRDLLLKEREMSDKLYAIKLVERLVFGMVGLILVAVLSAIVGLVLVK